jgi:hypothetical protein
MVNNEYLIETEMGKCEKCGSTSLVIIDDHKHLRDKHCLNTDCNHYVDETKKE